MINKIILLIVLILFPEHSLWAQNIFPNSGNVGIGTNNPKGALHIIQPGPPPGGLPSNENGLMLGVQNTRSYKWIQSYGGHLSLNPQGNNIGIGITKATHLLDVNGSTRIRANKANNILISGGEGDDIFIDMIKGSSGEIAARIEFEGFTDQSTNVGEIAFFTRGSNNSPLKERMRIKAGGTVTFGPNGPLVVGGNQVSLRNPRFRDLRTATREHACIHEMGSGWFSIGNCLSAAEYVPFKDIGSGIPRTGELVSLLPRKENPFNDKHAPFMVAKTQLPCDRNLMGFISNPRKGASGKKLNENYLPLAMYGYFPVKVTIENGPIERGDPITSSSKGGYGMKASPGCKTIGYALKGTNKEGVIQVFASLGEFIGPSIQELQGQIRELQTRLRSMEINYRVATAKQFSSTGQ